MAEATAAGAAAGESAAAAVMDDQQNGGHDNFQKMKRARTIFKNVPLEVLQYSIFMQLNEGESDLMVNKNELQRFLQFVKVTNPAGDDENQQVDQLDRTALNDKRAEEKIHEAFNKHQKNNFMDFRGFQAFLKDLELDDQDSCNEIDRSLYRKYFRGSWLRFFLCCGCCLRSFRGVRLK